MNDSWQYSIAHESVCKIIERETLWGQTVYRVWLLNQNAVVLVPESGLQALSIEQNPKIEKHRIAYIAAASKVAEILENYSTSTGNNLLLAPMESNVTPLPHQIHALSRAMANDRVRYLLADEVGLGKTIEAGLIMRELKLRGLVKRTLVVAPKSLAMQWVAEMETHFSESFTFINPSDLDVLERLEQPANDADSTHKNTKDYNPWIRFSQAIVTLDAVKPLTRRRGWTKEKIQEYNQQRYERLVQGQWDLIIVDESHRIGGSSEQVARHKLGQGLAEAAPYLLLLSATPHQGKSDAFHRLMSLLDPMTFPDLDSVTRDKVGHFVIRTEKRNAVTSDGNPLFKPRTTQTLNVDLNKNPSQLALYNAVTDYVREGYNRAIKDRKPHIGFLMVLLQRIVTSSSHAIRCTLERRLNILENLQEMQTFVGSEDLDDIRDFDGQTQLDMLVSIDEPGRKSEISEVKHLLDLARIAETTSSDSKTDALMNLIFQLQGEEDDDQLKILIFTEFVPTQSMLNNFLEERGFSCTILNGSMSMDERRIAQETFRKTARILISTDAGGEGLNLQFCHIVVNYDLPWNPMRIEQRIGRVDRIGQEKVVKAVNFVYENSVESRVREVLQEKLLIILNEIGIDKANDILNSSLSGEFVEKMMTQVIMEGADINTEVNHIVKGIHEELLIDKEQCSIYGISEKPNIQTAENIRSHPLPHWLEQMTTHYLQMKECKLEKTLFGWNFTWPDGKNINNAVFHAKDLSLDGKLLSLEDVRIRALAMNFQQFFPTQPISCITINELPNSLTGLWGLFEVCMSISQPTSLQIKIPVTRRSYFAVFIDKAERVFIPTAMHIWEQLLTNDFSLSGLHSYLDSNTNINLMAAAKQAGQKFYESMYAVHMTVLAREEERGATSFASRRKAIEHLGLPEVKQFRLARLNEDEVQWRHDLQLAKQVVPELKPLLMLHIECEGKHEKLA